MAGYKRADDVLKAQVPALVDSGYGYRTIARKLGVPVQSAKGWVHRYRRMGVLGLFPVSTHTPYSFETKLAAVQAFLAGTVKEEIMVTFAIRSRGQLDSWTKAYAIGGEDGLRPKRRGRPPTPVVETDARKIRRLEMENAALKKASALALAERLAKRLPSSHR